MDKKIILSLLIVALIGIVAATYQINNGVENLNPLSNVAVEENPVTQTLAAPEQSNDAAQASNQQQQQQNPASTTPSEATQSNQQPVDESNVESNAQTNDQANTQPTNQSNAQTDNQTNAQTDNQSSSQTDSQSNTEAAAQQTASTTNSQPQTASSNSEHVEGSNTNDGNNQGQSNPQTTIVVSDNPTGNGTSNNNGQSDNNQQSSNDQSANSNQQSSDSQATANNNAVEPDYSQNEGNTSQLDNDGEVLDSGIDASIISSSDVLSKLESFVQTKWQTEPVHLDNAQEYTSDSGERYYRYDIVRDSDNTVVGQASFNRRTGKVTMMDNSGPTN